MWEVGGIVVKSQLAMELVPVEQAVDILRSTESWLHSLGQVTPIHSHL